jgi:hypothetical protein
MAPFRGEFTWILAAGEVGAKAIGGGDAAGFFAGGGSDMVTGCLTDVSRNDTTFGT